MPVITVHGVPNDGNWEEFKHTVANKLIQAIVRVKRLKFCAADFVVCFPPPTRGSWRKPGPPKIIILVEHLFLRPDISKERERMMKHVAERVVTVMSKHSSSPVICHVLAPHPYDTFHSSYRSFKLLGD